MEGLHLPALVLRRIALEMPDPSSLLCASSAICKLADAAFEREWFSRWAPVFAPHRLWQLAAVTWRRLHAKRSGKPLQALVAFLLAMVPAKAAQQQQQPADEPNDEAWAAAAAAAQQQQQPADEPHDEGPWVRKFKSRPFEGQFAWRSAQQFADTLVPLPSTVRRARKLLAQDTEDAACLALLCLCPMSCVLLAAVLARSGASSSSSSSSSSSGAGAHVTSALLPLLQHVQRSHKADVAHTATSVFYESSQWGRYVPSYRLVHFAVLHAGCAGDLLSLLAAMRSSRTAGFSSTFEYRPFLLRHAVRCSNAACLNALLATTPAIRCDAQRVAPQHLAAAAGRSDPWAAGCVEVLLRVLAPKQLKPTHMRAAYEAACRSGHPPVLQALLAHAAGTAQRVEHLCVLLTAALDAGNAAVLDLLVGPLASSRSSRSSLQQQNSIDDELSLGLGRLRVQDSGGSSSNSSSQQGLLRASLDERSPARLLALLVAVLPAPPAGATAAATIVLAFEQPDAELRLAAADSIRAALTPGTQQMLQQLCAAARQPGEGSTSAFAGLARTTQPLAVAWLLQRRLLPVTADAVFVEQQLQPAMAAALRLGDSHTALQLLHSQQQLRCDVLARLAQADVSAVAESALLDAAMRLLTTKLDSRAEAELATCVLEGRLLAACRSCDAAAVDQVELLRRLSGALCIKAVGYVRPAGASVCLPHVNDSSVPGVAFADGRVVTVAHLAAWLGLPWAQLQSLLDGLEDNGAGDFVPPAGAAAAAAALSRAASGGASGGAQGADSSSSSGGGGSSIWRRDVQAAMAVAETPELYRQQLLAGSTEAMQDLQPGANGQQASWHVLLRHMIEEQHALLLPRSVERAAGTGTARYYMEDPDYAVVQQLAAWRHADTLALLQQHQQQRGPLPLWQLALLSVLAHHARTCKDDEETESLDVTAPDGVCGYCEACNSLLLQGLHAGQSLEAVQQLISARLLRQRPTDGLPAALRSEQAPIAQHLLRAALVLRLPQLLRFALDHKERLLGAPLGSIATQLAEREGCTPITLRPARVWPGEAPAAQADLHAAGGGQPPAHARWACQQQQQADARQLMEQQQQSLGCPGPRIAAPGPDPAFVATARTLALLILQQPDCDETCMSVWLTKSMRADASLADLWRARAIVAAVAAAPVVPPGARVLQREAVRNVLLVGDLDLWAAVLTWSNRLDVVPVEGDEGAVLGAGGDWDDEDVAMELLQGGANI